MYQYIYVCDRGRERRVRATGTDRHELDSVNCLSEALLLGQAKSSLVLFPERWGPAGTGLNREFGQDLLSSLKRERSAFPGLAGACSCWLMTHWTMLGLISHWLVRYPRQVGGSSTLGGQRLDRIVPALTWSWVPCYSSWPLRLSSAATSAKQPSVLGLDAQDLPSDQMETVQWLDFDFPLLPECPGPSPLQTLDQCL